MSDYHPRRLTLFQTDADVCVSILTGPPGKSRATRIWLSPDSALHAAHRLMAFAAGGQSGSEKVAEEQV